MVLVYDITSRKSFDDVAYWMEEIKNYCDTTPKVLLVGNKVDLITDKGLNRSVPMEEAMKYANENNMLYIETSALTHKNIDEAFNRLFQSWLTRYIQTQDYTKSIRELFSDHSGTEQSIRRPTAI